MHNTLTSMRLGTIWHTITTWFHDAIVEKLACRLFHDTNGLRFFLLEDSKIKRFYHLSMVSLMALSNQYTY